MGIKDFFNKITSGSKEANSNTDEKSIQNKITKKIETDSDGNKNIKLKLEGEKEVSMNIKINTSIKNRFKPYNEHYERERTFIGKTEYGNYEYEYLDANGEKRRFTTSRTNCR